MVTIRMVETRKKGIVGYTLEKTHGSPGTRFNLVLDVRNPLLCLMQAGDEILDALVCLAVGARMRDAIANLLDAMQVSIKRAAKM